MIRAGLLILVAYALIGCANGSAGCITYVNHRFQANSHDTSETLAGYADLDQSMMAVCE